MKNSIIVIMKNIMCHLINLKNRGKNNYYHQFSQNVATILIIILNSVGRIILRQGE